MKVFFLGPLIFSIFLNDIFYFATESDLYNYADDNCVSVSHTEINILSSYSIYKVKLSLWSNGSQIIQWEQTSVNFKAFFFFFFGGGGGGEQKNININVGESDICFVSKIEVLGVSIDDKLNFNYHVKRICSKASAQISALQRLTGLFKLYCRKFQLLPTCLFFLPAEKVSYDWKNPRTGTQICSPGPSVQLWCPFGKSWLWSLQNSRRKIVTCWNIQDFLTDYHLNICKIYSRNQAILSVWGIRINWFNH